MIKKILALILVIVAAIGGSAAGYFLRPQPPEEGQATDHTAEVKHTEKEPKTLEEPREYAPLSNQFIVPLLENGRIGSIMVLALSIETTLGSKDIIYTKEPKLRDEFLQVLFDYANVGGFKDTYTDATKLTTLRNDLRQSAQNIYGESVTDVLITDIIRQED